MNDNINILSPALGLMCLKMQESVPGNVRYGPDYRGNYHIFVRYRAFFASVLAILAEVWSVCLLCGGGGSSYVETSHWNPGTFYVCRGGMESVP